MKTIVIVIVLALASGAATVALASVNSAARHTAIDFVASIDPYDVTLTPYLESSR